MATTSGPALGNVIEGTFRHAPSGVSYRIYREGAAAFLSYERAEPSLLRGRQMLKYYVGSNTRGRTFLFDIDGFLYQSPINYYAAKDCGTCRRGTHNCGEMELNHPVDATCLFCHASRVQPRVKGTVNRFDGEPFLQPGVGCERCHGPGSEHIARRRADGEPGDAHWRTARRDLHAVPSRGQARIQAAGHRQDDYRPGAMLSDYLAIFVPADAATRDRRRRQPGRGACAAAPASVAAATRSRASPVTIRTCR